MSYSEIPVEIVERACLAYLDCRRKFILKEQEKEIEKAMRPCSLFGIKFGGKTREQAIKDLKSDVFNKYNLVTFQGGYHMAAINQLAALCTVPGIKTVKLSSEDAFRLKEFFS